MLATSLVGKDAVSELDDIVKAALCEFNVIFLARFNSCYI